jgi:hypothetical protein
MSNEARKLADVVHDAVDRGANTAEEIHKSIADLPLEVLEEVEPLKKLVNRVRKVQERSISAVYELVRGINEEVAKITRDVLPNGRGARQGGRSRTTTRQKARTKSRRKKAA